MQNAAVYWWQVTKIALSGAAEFLGWGHLARWPVSFASVCFAAAVYWFVIGDTRVPSEKMIWALYLVAGAGTVFFLVFVFMVLATPPRLAAEATVEYHQKFSGLESKIVQLGETLQQRRKSEGIRLNFNKLISRANELENAAVKSMEERYLRQMDADIDTWEASAREFVAVEFPDSLPLFESNATSLSGQVHSRHPAINRLLMRIRNRVERLTNLLPNL